MGVEGPPVSSVVMHIHDIQLLSILSARCRDLVVNQALLVSKVNAESEENLELKVLKVIAVSSVSKVFLAPS